MKILIIEDDADHARIVRQGLSRAGMTCDVAQSGDKGERMLAAGKYDAVVLDLMLPDIGGMEILRRLRSRRDDTPGFPRGRTTICRSHSLWTNSSCASGR